MDRFVSTLVSAVIQLVVFGAVPVIWWLVTARTTTPLLRWLGFVRPKIHRPVRLAVVGGLMVAISAAAAAGLQLLLRDVPNLAVSQFAGHGWSVFAAVLVYAWVQTSLTEEVLFRGFLLGRLETRVGFHLANVIQATVFGLMHVVLIAGTVSTVGPLAVVGQFVVPAALGWALGWIKRESGGSIIPTWIVHGLANTAAGLIAAFAA